MKRCEDATCRHVRYRHGDTRHGYNNRFVGHDAGPCRLCKCSGFHDVPPITFDTVIDMAELLGDEDKRVTLRDLGIEPFGTVCGTQMSRWEGVTAIWGKCVKDKHHSGEHEPVWEKK